MLAAFSKFFQSGEAHEEDLHDCNHYNHVLLLRFRVYKPVIIKQIGFENLLSISPIMESRIG